MKERAVGLRASTPVVVAAEAVVLVAFLALPPGGVGWWPAATIIVVALVMLMLTVHRRNLPGWIAALTRWRTHRRRPKEAAAAVDVNQGDMVCGVRIDAHEAITMIDVTGRPHRPTFLRGSAVSLTTNVLPLHVLTDLLDQPGGITLSGIDIVSSGARVRRGTGYPPLYSTLLGDRPAAGQRHTRLIVRLDLISSVSGLSYRSTVGAAAASATERIVNALLQNKFRATAMTAAEIDAALGELSVGFAEAPAPPQPPEPLGGDAFDPEQSALVGAASRPGLAVRPEAPASARTPIAAGWRSISARPGHLTTYYFSPEDITTVALQQMWALRADDIVQVVSLTKRHAPRSGGDGPVMASALVRTNDPQQPQQPPTLYLNTMPGDQIAALLRAAPTATPRLQLPQRRLAEDDDLIIPIGPTGVLVGAAINDHARSPIAVRQDDMVMWALTDPQRATRIGMDTSDFYVRQLLLRAAAVGERVAIYSNEPARWASLSQPNISLVERNRPLELVPTIIVNDRAVSPPPTGLSSTTITLGPIDRGPAPEIRFVQTSRSNVRITGAGYDIEVAIVAFRQEQAWTG